MLTAFPFSFPNLSGNEIVVSKIENYANRGQLITHQVSFYPLYFAHFELIKYSFR